jgi:hypothetical protein
MAITISTALGTRRAMFYHDAWSFRKLVPGCTIDKSINQVNQSLKTYGRCLAQWSWHEQDEIARLCWVNWIYNRLSKEPIRKPVLTHEESDQLVVDCGDTRLMSLELTEKEHLISVIAVVDINCVDRYQQWSRIYSEQDLIRLTKFSNDAVVLLRPGINKAIEWLEIGDITTTHHLHDREERIQMMQCYLLGQSDDFKFSRNWAKSVINWNGYKA